MVRGSRGGVCRGRRTRPSWVQLLGDDGDGAEDGFGERGVAVDAGTRPGFLRREPSGEKAPGVVFREGDAGLRAVGRALVETPVDHRPGSARRAVHGDDERSARTPGSGGWQRVDEGGEDGCEEAPYAPAPAAHRVADAKLVPPPCGVFERSFEPGWRWIRPGTRPRGAERAG